MFATLASGYPRPPVGADASADETVRALIEELLDAGLEILSDGGLRHADPLGGVATHLQGLEIGEPAPYLDSGRTYRRPRAIHEPRFDGPIFVRDWQTAAAMSQLPVKQAIVGPYTLGRVIDPGPLSRERLTMALADALAHELRALVAAGCPMIQVHEDAATLIGEDGAEQKLFKAAHRRLTNPVRDAHLTLAVTGGSVGSVPANVFFDAPYRSYLIDIVSADENWALILAAPGERGIILGAADARTATPDNVDALSWAALYAASLRGRGPERVGLAPSGSLAGLSWQDARAKVDMLAMVAAKTHASAIASPELLDAKGLAQEGLTHEFFGFGEGGAIAKTRAGATADEGDAR